MEELSAGLVKLVESGSDLRDLVIGTYIGTPEINTNIAVNIGGRVKRMNKSNIKLEIKQQPQVSNPTAPDVVEAPVVEPLEGDDDNDGVCSFCGEKWIKKTVVEGFNTYLCRFHLQLETQLAKL